MNLKQTPEDFQVEELTDVTPGEGPFSLYRLDKKGWTTPDAVQAIRRRWQLERRRLSYGGLKDRHAQTSQHFTVFRGPQRKLTHQGFTVTYLGQASGPFLAEHIRANRFQIMLRDVSREERVVFAEAFEEVRALGVPNYFDDQRFGSVTPGTGGAGDPTPTFLAMSMMLGRFEEALKIALTGYYAHDRGPQKKEKAILRAHWGDWQKCKELLPKSHARSLADYLAGHPDDFRGALARLRPELRGLYLSAYQSHLWNRMLAAWLRAHVDAEKLAEIPLKLGPLPMPRALAEAELEQLRALQLPLHSHRVVFEPGDPRQHFFDQILQEENLTLDHFKLKGFREMFFARGERPALCMPANFQHAIGADDTHGGKVKIRLAFELPRGSYATLLVKRLFTSADL